MDICCGVFFKFILLLLRVVKGRNKMFAMYLRKISFIKYIQHKNIPIECREPFYFLFLFRKPLTKCIVYFRNVSG